ncbi:MAG: transporter ATP-binding protein, partial [Polaromonas sp.]|nr:transporter ATP-binding protein [Polaromonas sp.]
VMTARPGRIERVIDIPAALKSETADVRSLPLFGSVRHEIWSLLQQAPSPSIHEKQEVAAHV